KVAVPRGVVQPGELAIDEEAGAALVAHSLIAVTDARVVEVAHGVRGIKPHQHVAVPDDDASWHSGRLNRRDVARGPAALNRLRSQVRVAPPTIASKPSPHSSEPTSLNNHQNSFSPPIRILATRRRRRTVSARLRSGVLEVMVPASMSVAERERWVELMRDRIERQMRRKLPTDQRLAERAQRLN